MRVLVVADKNGTAKFNPFVDIKRTTNHPFWLDRTPFNVTKDGRVKISKKFMDEHGFLRKDGRRALILSTGARYYPEQELSLEQIKRLPGKDPATGKYYVQGGEILTGKPFEEYYEGKTGDIIPKSVGSGEDYTILEAYDSPDIYGENTRKRK